MTRRRVLRALLVLVLLIAGAAAAALLWLRSTLPRKQGTITVAGLQHPVTIVTDAGGVPRIQAETLEDGAFAMGYIHAQDRFFQMDLARRLVEGRLAELLGPALLPLDRRSRTLGFAGFRQSEIEALNDHERSLLSAYAEGVNAQLRAGGAPWALRLLRAGAPQPWRPIDSAALVIYMDDRLSLDGDERLRVATAARVGRRAADWMRDVEPQDSPAIVVREEHPAAPSSAAGAVPGARAAPRPAGPGVGRVGAARVGPEGLGVHGVGPGGLGVDGLGTARVGVGPLGIGALEGEAREHSVGSNSWAVDGRWTRSGRPLLCNDTHLAHALPVLFHAFELRLPDRTLAGLAIPGTPLMVVGTNGALAWGLTTLYDDAIDYVEEEFVPGDSTRVVRPDGFEPVQERVELIAARGRERPDTLRVRRTANGPLLRLPGYERPCARRWVREAGGGTLAAMLRLQEATSLEQARAALSGYAGPGQSFVLADTLGTDGRVGYVPAGRWPRRARSEGGAWPVAGAVRPGGVPELAPFSERPLLLPSPDGAVVSANHRVAFGEDGRRIAPFWPLPWRAERIEERLRAQRPLEVPSMAAVQLDPVVVPARRLAQLLARTAAPATASPEVRSWWEQLARWDGAMAGDARPTLYRALIDRLQEEIFGDDWPDALPARPPERWALDADPLPLERAVLRVLGLLGEHPLAAPDDSLDARAWIDDRRTPQVESLADILARAMEWALRAVRARYGERAERWRWDRVHTVTIAHPLARIPGLGRWLQLGPLAVPGDRDAPCANAAQDEGDLEVDTIPVMRVIVDLGDVRRSRFILSTGQSEHPLSRWFGDQFTLWARGEYRPLLADATAGSRRLVLAPAHVEQEAAR